MKRKSTLIYVSMLAAITVQALANNGIRDFINKKYCSPFQVNCECICTNSCGDFDCSTVDTETSARVTAIKALNRMPIDPVNDFPVNVAAFTPEEQEEYRREFTKNISCVFGNPVGWKLAVGAATPSNPILGYTAPVLGRILNGMIFCGAEATIRNNYAVLPIYEVCVYIRVSDAAINQAKTRADIVNNIDAVIPSYELAAGFVPTIQDLLGPDDGGNSLLILLNGAARLNVFTPPIPVPGSRTTAEWISVLSDLNGQEVVTIDNGPPIIRPFNDNVDFLNFALILIQQIHDHGFEVQVGDVLGLGTVTGALTGVNPFEGNETKMVATYTNIDPNGTVTVTMNVDNENGICVGDASRCT